MPIACSSLHPGVVLDVPARRDRVTLHISPARSEGTYSSLGRRANIGFQANIIAIRACGLRPGQSFSTRQRPHLCTPPSDRLPSLRPIKHRRVAHIKKCRDVMIQRSPFSVCAAPCAASNQRAP